MCSRWLFGCRANRVVCEVVYVSLAALCIGVPVARVA
jgi:hypothetical protein